MKAVPATLVLLLSLVRVAQADVILDNCAARWAPDQPMVETCAIDQIIARDELERLWSKVGRQLESVGVWKSCQQRWPGIVAGYDWVLVKLCVDGDLNTAQEERQGYQRRYREDVIQSNGRLWYRYGPRAYGPDGQVCDYNGNNWRCR
jgi:hypothetical protein